MNEKKKAFHLKSLTVAIVMGLLVGTLAQGVGAVANIPRDPTTKQPFVSLVHLGGKACRTEGSTTPTSCATAAGVLYELCSVGTAVTSGMSVQAFDTSVASTISALFQAARWISPNVYGTADGDSQPPIRGCWQPEGGIRFENGLTLMASDAAVQAFARYRLDTGVNP